MTHQFPTAAITAILPPPFAWIAIPAGATTLDHSGGYLLDPVTQDISAFDMARCPVTTAQYQVFVDASDGYADESWWDYSDAALEWRLENPRSAGVGFGGGDSPRTHVTWYEAAAFCRWLSAKTGDLIRLPTEAEWQRAAQGDDGRTYPWGNEWDETRCHNNLASGSIGPVSVLTYVGKGDSPFGVVDMVGNVWEWCLTQWNTGANTLEGDEVRVLRGGSWFDGVMKFFRTTHRSSWNPDITSDLRGFRIVRDRNG